MDDILNTLDDRALNELTTEPQAPPVQGAGPLPSQPVQPRPTGRADYQVPVLRPMMRPAMPAQPVAQPQPQLNQTQPQSVQPQPFQPSAALQQPIGQPVPVFQRPQPNAMPPVAARAVESAPANAKAKTSIPKGIYIIIGLTLLDVAISFLSANTSMLYSVAIVAELLLAVGLLTKISLARQSAVVFQAVNICLILFVILGLMGTESRINQLTIKYNDAVAQASIHASPQQEVAIDNLNTQMNMQRKAIGKAIGIDYVRNILAIGVSGGIIWYLTRPRVKDAFR